MTTYEQYHADRLDARAAHAQVAQPLDIAVLSVDLSPRLPSPPTAAFVLRTGYLRRAYAHEQLPPALHEQVFAARGS